MRPSFHPFSSLVSFITFFTPRCSLAELLCRSSSFAKSVFFCNSGTEANEGALKFARKVTKQLSPDKTHFVSFYGGFHGRSMGALSVTANPKYQDPFRPLIPGVEHLKLNDLPALSKTITDHTSAVIVEPIQGEGGINMPTVGFLQELRERCTRKNVVLIFDEIQCGMGRTGKLWAHEHAGVTPDILTVAKALGNGYPIGAILVNERVTEALKYGDHGSTFAGQPLACALGLTVLSKINRPSFLQHVTEVGQNFRRGVEALGSPLVREVRGRGLILGIDIDLAKAGIKDLSPLTQSFSDKGVVLLTAGESVLRVVPPLIITKKEVDEALQVFKQVFSEFPAKA